MNRKRASFVVLAVAILSLAALATSELIGREPGSGDDQETDHAIPIDGPFSYKAKYLGITCGHMVLESRLATYEGREAYHIIMTARNSKFFNKIYKVDGRIESWVDAESLSSLAYESTINEKGKNKVKRYRVDRETGVVTAENKGKVKEIPFDGEPALDPLGFVYRSRVLAGASGSSFSLRLLTDYGSIETISQVGELKRFKTVSGKKELLRVQPLTADGEMFSRKGEFVMWVDPENQRVVYRLDFKLGFGRLIAELTGPAPK
jgi:hypothetical protein